MTLATRLVAVLSLLVLIVGACASPAIGTGPPPTVTSVAASPAVSVEAGGSAAAATPGLHGSLKLGYFPNITHATAIVGVEGGIFARHLGPGVTLDTATFNAGSSALEALLNGAVDATYIGPNPAINGYARSGGAALRIIAGATSGGAHLVVRPSITGVADLKGTKLATPQLGNTQDVALRTWLLEHGLKTDVQGGGDVSILPQDNAQTLEAFVAGSIDGAWVPEPWATRLVQDGGGKVLVDEGTLWAGGLYVTTQLIVGTDYLAAHPDIVSALLAGDIEANALVNADPARARTLTNQGIEKITGKQLETALIEAAWKSLTFTVDPIASSLKTSADHAVAVGLLPPVDLSGIYDLGPLNAQLRLAGQPEVRGP